MYQSPPNSIDFNETLMLMKIEDVINYFKSSGFKGYLCAVDKSFVLYTDVDFQFSLWGSNKFLAAELQKVVEILPTSSDYKANI